MGRFHGRFWFAGAALAEASTMGVALSYAARIRHRITRHTPNPTTRPARAAIPSGLRAGAEKGSGIATIDQPGFRTFGLAPVAYVT